MIIIGVDYDPSDQYVAFVDTPNRIPGSLWQRGKLWTSFWH